MIVVQEMCARIGMVTGRGLAENIRREYSRTALFVCIGLLVFANTINIGADVGAMADVTRIFLPQVNAPFLIAFFAIGSCVVQIITPYETYARYLKYLAILLFSYIITGFIVHLDWREVAIHTVMPSLTFSKDALFLVCAIFGTTISPYLFFWQSSQEVEEEIEKGHTTIDRREGATDAEMRDMHVDVWSGMFVSNVVMFFIIAVCAATLYAHGMTDITTAAQAASALTPLAGPSAGALFALGILGTGLLAVPVLAASNAYEISEAFNWREGLYNKPLEAYRFYGVIFFSMMAALFFNFIGIDPIKALIYAAVVNGVVAPVMIYYIVRLSGDSSIMGERVNGPISKVLGWLLIAIMGITGIAAIASFFV